MSNINKDITKVLFDNQPFVFYPFPNNEKQIELINEPMLVSFYLHNHIRVAQIWFHALFMNFGQCVGGIVR